MSTKLYVGNLPYEAAAETDLQTLFETSGQVASINPAGPSSKQCA